MPDVVRLFPDHDVMPPCDVAAPAFVPDGVADAILPASLVHLAIALRDLKYPNFAHTVSRAYTALSDAYDKEIGFKKRVAQLENRVRDQHETLQLQQDQTIELRALLARYEARYGALQEEEPNSAR